MQDDDNFSDFFSSQNDDDHAEQLTSSEPRKSWTESPRAESQDVAGMSDAKLPIPNATQFAAPSQKTSEQHDCFIATPGTQSLAPAAITNAKSTIPHDLQNAACNQSADCVFLRLSDVQLLLAQQENRIWQSIIATLIQNANNMSALSQPAVPQPLSQPSVQTQLWPQNANPQIPSSADNVEENQMAQDERMTSDDAQVERITSDEDEDETMSEAPTEPGSPVTPMPVVEPVNTPVVREPPTAGPFETIFKAPSCPSLLENVIIRIASKKHQVTNTILLEVPTSLKYCILFIPANMNKDQLGECKACASLVYSDQIEQEKAGGIKVLVKNILKVGNRTILGSTIQDGLPYVDIFSAEDATIGDFGSLNVEFKGNSYNEKRSFRLKIEFRTIQGDELLLTKLSGSFTLAAKNHWEMKNGVFLE